jgi:lipopolysaccharide export system permease protein
VPTRLTRYMMWEIAKPFAFFVIVFTGLVWLTQALRVLDTVVENGETAIVFLEFSALLMPVVLAIALPLAAFGATVHATSRMLAESEIVAMLAAGLSGVALARPAALFGALVMARRRARRSICSRPRRRRCATVSRRCAATSPRRWCSTGVSCIRARG